MTKIGIAAILYWVAGMVFIITAIIGVIKHDPTPFYWGVGIAAALVVIAIACVIKWFKKPFG